MSVSCRHLTQATAEGPEGARAIPNARAGSETRQEPLQAPSKLRTGAVFLPGRLLIDAENSSSVAVQPFLTEHLSETELDVIRDHRVQWGSKLADEPGRFEASLNLPSEILRKHALYEAGAKALTRRGGIGNRWPAAFRPSE